MSLQDELRTLVEDVVRKVVREEFAHAREPAMPGSADAFLSVTAAASLADVAPATIRAWLKAGKLRRYGTGGRILRVQRSELVALLESAGGGSTADDTLSPEALANRDHARTRGRHRRAGKPPE